MLATNENAKEMLSSFADSLQNSSDVREIEDKAESLKEDIENFVGDELASWLGRAKSIANLAWNLSLDGEAEQVKTELDKARFAFNNALSILQHLERKEVEHD